MGEGAEDGGRGRTVHPSIWERFPLAGKEKQFPDPLVFLGQPFSDVILALSLPAEMRHSDVKAFIGWRKQWNRDLEPRGCG